MKKFIPFIPNEFPSRNKTQHVQSKKKNRPTSNQKTLDLLTVQTSNQEDQPSNIETAITEDQTTTYIKDQPPSNDSLSSTEDESTPVSKKSDNDLYNQNTVDIASSDEEKKVILSEEEFTITKAIAYQEGYDQACLDNKDNIQKNFIAALTTLTNTLQQHLDKKNFHLDALTLHVSDVLVALFRKILPHFVEIYGTQEIISFVQEILPNLQDEDELMFHFSEHQKNVLEKEIPGLIKKNGYKGNYTLQFSQNLDPMFIEIVWKLGSLKLDPALIDQDIDKALAHLKKNNQPINKPIITWKNPSSEHDDQVAP